MKRRQPLLAPVWQLLGGRMRDRLRLYWSHCGTTWAGASAQKLELQPVRTIADLVDDAPWRDDLMSHPFEVQDGHLILPERPGLGSDLIESELEKHPPDHYPDAR